MKVTPELRQELLSMAVASFTTAMKAVDGPPVTPMAIDALSDDLDALIASYGDNFDPDEYRASCVNAAERVVQMDQAEPDALTPFERDVNLCRTNQGLSVLERTWEAYCTIQMLTGVDLKQETVKRIVAQEHLDAVRHRLDDDGLTPDQIVDEVNSVLEQVTATVTNRAEFRKAINKACRAVRYEYNRYVQELNIAYDPKAYMELEAIVKTMVLRGMPLQEIKRQVREMTNQVLVLMKQTNDNPQRRN